VPRYSRSSQNCKRLDNIFGDGFDIPTVAPLHRLMIYSADLHIYAQHIMSVYLRSPSCPRRRELLPSMLVSKEDVQTIETYNPHSLTDRSQVDICKCNNALNSSIRG
jgi:hypothetical protein